MKMPDILVLSIERDIDLQQPFYSLWLLVSHWISYSCGRHHSANDQGSHVTYKLSSGSRYYHCDPSLGRSVWTGEHDLFSGFHEDTVCLIYVKNNK